MAQEDVVDGTFIRCTYNSLDEMADAARRRINAGGYTSADKSASASWTLGASFDDALELARNGWTEHLDSTLSIAESAVETCEQTHEVFQPQMTFDVSGDSVDIGRYLAGEPECMVDYPLTVTSSAGRVVTLCAGMFYSASMDADALVKRGQVVTALAIALSRLGHSVELWADIAGRSMGDGTLHGSVRVLVKGADDVLDPAKILFAFAHPAFFRRLGFAVLDGTPPRFEAKIGYRGSYMCVDKVKRDLPEGTIYLEGVGSEYNLPDAHAMLRKHLSDLGLITES